MKNLLRKLIRESIDKVLDEDAMKMSHLPEGTGLFIREINSGYDLVLYNPKLKNVYAIITIVLREAENYFVAGVAAERGFGPFIYELAMMHINKEGKGLMPTRDGVIRGEAWNVWKKFYAARPDVDKKSLSILDKNYNFNIIDDIYWESDEEKTEIYDELSPKDKVYVNIFNTAFFLAPSAEYEKLKEIASQWTKNGFDNDIAIEAGDEFWQEKYGL